MKKNVLIGVLIIIILIIAGYFIFTNFFSNTEPLIEGTPIEKSCISSGGSLVNIDCYCSATNDYYDTCLIGGCACIPDPNFKRTIKSCECPEGKCFNKSSCVAIKR